MYNKINYANASYYYAIVLFCETFYALLLIESFNSYSEPVTETR